MANVVDTLVTEYRMKNQQYLQGASQVGTATRLAGSAITAAQRGMAGFGSTLGGVQKGLSGFSTGIATVVGQLPLIGGVLTGLVAATTGLAGYAMAQAAELEALTLGLQNFTGSAEATEKALARLKEVAKLPGLSFKEAIEGSIRLQAVGFDARLAERALMGFGNALASVGKGKEELDGVILAVSQILSKGVISAEEINQIAERVPQIRQLMQKAFGTGRSEDFEKMGIGPQAFVKGIITELEKLPKAANASKNFFENVGDIGFRAFASIGSVLNKVVIPELEKVVSFVSFLTESGALESIATSLIGLTGAGSGSGNALVSVFALVAATLEQMPMILKGMSLIFQGLFDRATTIINTILKALQGLGESWVGRKLGLGDLAGIGTVLAGGDSKKTGEGMFWLNAAGQEIDTRKKEMLAGFNNQPTTSDAASGGPGGFTIPDVLRNIDSTNRQIADNTRKALDLQRSIIGGGQVAQQALSGLNVDRAAGGSSTKAKLIRAIDDFVNESLGKQLAVDRRPNYRR